MRRKNTRRHDHSGGRGRCHGGKEMPRWHRMTQRGKALGGLTMPILFLSANLYIGNDQDASPGPLGLLR